MKTKFILFLLLLFAGMVSAQVKRVAILETVDKEDKVSYTNELILRQSISKAITNTPGYEVYDRTDIDAIMSEHSFQRTGLVSNDQIKQLGQMTGAKYILVAEAAKSDAKHLFVTAKLLDVETARTIFTESLEVSIDKMQRGCDALAKKMFNGGKNTANRQQYFSPSDGPQLVKNSKIDQRLLGLEKYTCDGVQMNQKALAGFLRNNSYETYKRYLRAQSCVKAGWVLFGIGAISTVTGGLAWVLSDIYYHKYETMMDAMIREEYYDNYGGIYNLRDERGKYLKIATDFYRNRDLLFQDLSFLIYGGSGLVAISVPLLSTGYSIKNNIHKYYNENANTKPVFTLNLQYNQNGLGLALTF